MDEKINLPIVNEEGCYEIRLESIGGLGANLCGKLWENWGHRIWGSMHPVFPAMVLRREGHR